MIGKRGQAATELAIFGSIMLMIVAAMLNYGQTLATQQELQMYAFRRALQFSRARINDGGAARQAEFTVFKEVYPVNLLESGVAKTRISASASVDWESDSSTLTGEDPQDFGVQYWQLGRRMIRDNQLIELPKMKVKVKRDDNMPRGFLGYVWEFISGSGGGEQDMYMSAPIDQSLTNKVTVSENMDSNTESGGQTMMSRNAQTQEEGTLTLLMQPDLAHIKKFNPDVISLKEPIPPDITITESEKTLKDKAWETPVE